MTIIIGYQGEDHVVIGSDLLVKNFKRSNNFKKVYSLEEKIRKSKKGEHYIGYTGTISDNDANKIDRASLKSLLSEFETHFINPITKISCFAIDVKNNQLYFLNGNSVLKLRNNIVRICGYQDFLKKPITSLIQGKLESIDEKAESVKQTIIHASKQAPRDFQGVSVYHVQDGQIKPYYHSK